MANHDITDYGFKCVNPPCGVVLRWADPKTVNQTDWNPRDHPPEQTDAVAELMDKHGWLLPLVYNLQTRRLIDGHDRIGIAIEQGYDAVPIWVGCWPEEDEPAIILALSETGRMAKWNPGKTESMLSRLTDTSAAVRKLIDDLAKREGLAEYVDRCKEKTPVFLTTETPPPADQVGSPEIDPEIAQRAMQAETPSLIATRVRLVQLFVDRDDVERFNEWVEDLQEMWGVTSVTDAVMRTLSDAHLAYLRGGRRRRS